MRLYAQQVSHPKFNAQRNLEGRTHYVDDDNLRYHKSRVISARPIGEGLLFAIVTSDALDMHNTKRGFRFVVFDIYGSVIARTPLEGAFRTSEQATKAMWSAVNAIDAKAVTLDAIDRAEHNFLADMVQLRKRVNGEG